MASAFGVAVFELVGRPKGTDGVEMSVSAQLHKTPA
jgi:hypothetical protein